MWLAEPSRFARWKRGPARAVLALVLVLMAACLLSPDLRPADPFAPPPREFKPGETDLGLYQAVVDRVRGGEDYYAVVAQELRTRPGNALRPFVTFRPPLLAELQATLPQPVSTALLYLLVAAVALAWIVRITQAVPAGAPRIVAAMLLGAGLVTSMQSFLLPSHELWSSLLIALSLAVRRPGRWVEAAALATAAMLIRELAALYVLIMLAFAWRDGERREALGWAVALTVFAIALAAHAWAVAQVTGPLDPVSDGWSGMNGVWFVVQCLRQATVLDVFPYLAAIPVVILAGVGWASWRDPVSARMLATIIAYGLLIGLAARVNNFYWGLMISPVFLLGLVFAPDGVRDLVRAARDRRRITVTRIVR